MEVKPITKIGPFDYVTSICKGARDDIMHTVVDEKQYLSFIVNRALSYHQDCILLANEMNCKAVLDNRLQYVFLKSTIRPRKRFSKWSKKVSTKKLNTIKAYYNYTDEKASAVMELISDDQIKVMNHKMNKGGRK
tara:strand:- start:3252 stop:3656 length:405 start_codon:yes stop_codon:yes gene_type:complete